MPFELLWLSSNFSPLNLFINDVFVPLPLWPINAILYTFFTLDSSKLGILYTYALSEFPIFV